MQLAMQPCHVTMPCTSPVAHVMATLIHYQPLGPPSKITQYDPADRVPRRRALPLCAGRTLLIKIAEMVPKNKRIQPHNAPPVPAAPAAITDSAGASGSKAQAGSKNNKKKGKGK
jgi:hypothetical protein